MRKEPQSPEAFRRAFGEEVSVSREYGLPLTLLVAVMDGEWTAEAQRRALASLRWADLAARLDPRELAIALPNTGPEGARIVEERLREDVPGIRLASAAYRRGETAEALLSRARRTAADPGP